MDDDEDSSLESGYESLPESYSYNILDLYLDPTRRIRSMCIIENYYYTPNLYRHAVCHNCLLENIYRGEYADDYDLEFIINHITYSRAEDHRRGKTCSDCNTNLYTMYMTDMCIVCSINI